MQDMIRYNKLALRFPLKLEAYSIFAALCYLLESLILTFVTVLLMLNYSLLKIRI